MAESLLSGSPAIARRYVVTLVHGTFASRSEDRRWTLRGSNFCKALESGLAPTAVTFTDPFVWDGRNSYRSRALAAKCLANTVRSGTPQEGDRRILIGHSHGGNVIMYALKELGAGDVHGVVCMATPHLSVRVLPLERSFAAMGFILSLVAAMVYAIAIAIPAYDAGVALDGQRRWLWGLGFLASLVVPYWLVAGLLCESATRKARRMAEKLAPPTSAHAAILSINVVRDEAEALLSSQRRWSRVADPLWRHGVSAIGWLLILSMILVLLIGLEPSVQWVADLVFKTTFILAILLVLVLAVMQLLRLVLRSHPLGYGWESLVTRSYLDVSVQPLLAGSGIKQETFKYDDRDEDLDEQERRGMARHHSYVYRSRTVRARVAEWVGAFDPQVVSL